MAPEGVNEVEAKLIAGGGSAGRHTGGGAGGGGGYTSVSVPVVPFKAYSYEVGCGGQGNHWIHAAGSPGGPTKFAGHMTTGGMGGSGDESGSKGGNAGVGQTASGTPGGNGLGPGGNCGAHNIFIECPGNIGNARPQFGGGGQDGDNSWVAGAAGLLSLTW